MNRRYAKLTRYAILKSRYGQWQFIHTQKRERERLLIEESGAEVMLFLLRGNSLQETCRAFDLSRKELEDFLTLLTKEDVVELRDTAYDSTSECYAIDPPLDCINVLITNACNLRCSHCYVESGMRINDELDGIAWIGILEQARRLGAFRVNVTGGEPLLHKDFLEIAEYIASVSTFNANLNTNGTLVRKQHGKLIAEAFTSVQISIDDAIAEKHDAFRGIKGCFEKSVRTIEQFVASGVEVNVGFSLTRENFGAVDGVIELCERLGVNALGIGLVAPIGRASANNLTQQKLFPLQENDFLDNLYQKLHSLSGRNTRVNVLLPFRVRQCEESTLEEKRYICDGDNKQTLYVMADGTAMPCDKLPCHTFGCGNLKKTPLAHIWMSQKMKAFKLMSLQDLPECRGCQHLKICGGACIARAFHVGGSLESLDPASCFMAQKIADQRQMRSRRG